MQWHLCTITGLIAPRQTSKPVVYLLMRSLRIVASAAVLQSFAIARASRLESKVACKSLTQH
jgi:hypothetical protein